MVRPVQTGAVIARADAERELAEDSERPSIRDPPIVTSAKHRGQTAARLFRNKNDTVRRAASFPQRKVAIADAPLKMQT